MTKEELETERATLELAMKISASVPPGEPTGAVMDALILLYAKACVDGGVSNQYAMDAIAHMMDAVRERYEIGAWTKPKDIS